MEKIRPKSITITAWIIIVIGVLIFWSIPMTIKLSNMPQFQQLNTGSVRRILFIQGLTGLIYLISGTLMLKGKNWGRLLYIGSTGIFILLSLFSEGFSALSIPRIILYIVFIIVLTRPSASDFFKSL